MINLYNKLYSINDLKKNIHQINLWEILKTQIIDEEFSINYILNPKYRIAESEKFIDIEDILFHQPHLKKENLLLFLSRKIKK